MEKRITNEVLTKNKIYKPLNTKEKIIFLNLYCRGNVFNDGTINLNRTFTTVEQLLKTNINKYDTENKESRRSLIKIIKSLIEKGYIYYYDTEPMYLTIITFLTQNHTETRYTKLNTKIITETKRLDLTPNEVIIYHILKCYSKGKDYTNISIKRIMEDSGLSKQSVINTIKELEEKEIIKIDKAINKVNTYYLKNRNGNYFLDNYINKKELELKIKNKENII